MPPKGEGKWKRARAERTACWKEGKCEKQAKEEETPLGCKWGGLGGSAQAEEVGSGVGASTSGNTNTFCHWASTINWRGWGSSREAHPSDLVNIWLK